MRKISKNLVGNVQAPTNACQKNRFAHLAKYKMLYLMLLPGIVYFIIFRYLPMFGLVIAFKDYDIFAGIWDSEWVGFENFSEVFSSPDFSRIFLNTLSISFGKIIFGFPIPIILAIMLNEIRCTAFKRLSQSLLYLPHFLSWVVISGIMLNFFSPVSGAIGDLFRLFDIEAFNIMADKDSIYSVIILSDIWKESGWSTIIYMAALTQIDPALYEAAEIEGANKFKQIINITIPTISNIIILMLILKVGRIMNAGFEQILVLQNPVTTETIDIFDTFVYREGLTQGRYSFAATIDMFKSIIALSLVMITNKISRIWGGEGIA